MASNQTSPPVAQAKTEKVEVIKLVSVSADRIGEHTITAPRELYEPFVVAVIGKSGLPEQLTFHHPIGQTKLPRGAWVCTPTKEVHTLIARAKDPDDVEITRNETIALNDLWVEAGLLEKGTGGDFLYKSLKVSRKGSLDAAERALKERLVELRADHAKEHANKVKKPVFKTALTMSSFLTEEVKAEEVRLHKWKKENESKLREKVPRTYETCSGALGETRQISVPYLKEGIDADAARMLVYQHIYRSAIGLQKEAPIQPKPAPRPVMVTTPPVVRSPEPPSQPALPKMRWWQGMFSSKKEASLTVEDCEVLLVGLDTNGNTPISGADVVQMLGKADSELFFISHYPAWNPKDYSTSFVDHGKLKSWLRINLSTKQQKVQP